MTIAAIFATEAKIFAWADAEVFVGDEPISQSKLKLFVNPIAGIVGVGAGISVMTDKAVMALLSVADFDEAAEILPDILHENFEECKKTAREFCFSIEGFTYAVAGFSHRLKMNLVMVCSSTSNFGPRFAREWSSPQINYYIDDECEIEWAAHAQLRELRVSYPKAQGSVFVVATLRGSEFVITRKNIFSENNENESAVGLGSVSVDGSAGALERAPAEPV
jgi:hypothetical protein